jgi:hypothetical protein
MVSELRWLIFGTVGTSYCVAAIYFWQILRTAMDSFSGCYLAEFFRGFLGSLDIVRSISFHTYAVGVRLIFVTSFHTHFVGSEVRVHCLFSHLC